ELIEIAYAFEQATLLRRPPEVATQPADFNHDGVIDAADLTQWQGDFGQNDESDADHDGDSDGADFLAWQQHIGSGTSSSSAQAPVPEPTTLALLMIAAISWRARRGWSILNSRRGERMEAAGREFRKRQLIQIRPDAEFVRQMRRRIPR